MPDPLFMLIGGAIVAAFALGLGIGGWESPPPGTAEGVSAGTVERRVKMKEQTDAMERARDAAVRNIIRDGTKLETVCAEMGFDAGVAYAAALEAGKAQNVSGGALAEAIKNAICIRNYPVLSEQWEKHSLDIVIQVARAALEAGKAVDEAERGE
jgi:hypothetical protein